MITLSFYLVKRLLSVFRFVSVLVVYPWAGFLF